jgi:predicted nucleic acid-binding Zn ribbon protein
MTKRYQGACHNACSEKRTLENRSKKAFDKYFDEKSMEIGLSVTSKSWCLVCERTIEEDE